MKKFNDTLAHYNKIQKRQILDKTLKAESKLVRKESMSVLKDFESVFLSSNYQQV